MDRMTRQRLADLTDYELFHREPVYHAQVVMFRQWITVVEQALTDEGVSGPTVARVINRLIAGAPQPYDGHLREHAAAEMTEKLMNGATFSAAERKHIAAEFASSIGDGEAQPHPELDRLREAAHARPGSPGTTDTAGPAVC